MVHVCILLSAKHSNGGGRPIHPGKRCRGVCFTTYVTGADAVASDDKVSLPGFLTFERGHRAARTGKNPQTGEPLKIKTWTQFYRAAGPPVFARTGALLASFYCAGYASAWAASRWPSDR